MTFVLFQNYVGNVNRWHFLNTFSIHSKSCRLVYLDKQKQTLILKISFIISELHILRECTHIIMPHSWSQVCQPSCHCFLVKCHVPFSFPLLSFESYVFFSHAFWVTTSPLFILRPHLLFTCQVVLMCPTQCFFDSLNVMGRGGGGGPDLYDDSCLVALSCFLLLLANIAAGS